MHAYCGHSVMVAVMVTDGDGDHDGHGDGGAGDVSSFLAQFSVPTACRYMAHSPSSRDSCSFCCSSESESFKPKGNPLYSALSQLKGLAGML